MLFSGLLLKTGSYIAFLVIVNSIKIYLCKLSASQAQWLVAAFSHPGNSSTLFHNFIFISV